MNAHRDESALHSLLSAEFYHNKDNTYNRCGVENSTPHPLCPSCTHTPEPMHAASISPLTVISHLQCTCSRPVISGYPSGAANPHHIFAIAHFLCFYNPLSLSFSLSLPLSLSLSLSGFPAAHAVETLYLIHYNTSRLTPSQMGGWLTLELDNCAALLFEWLLRSPLAPPPTPLTF